MKKKKKRKSFGRRKPRELTLSCFHLVTLACEADVKEGGGGGGIGEVRNVKEKGAKRGALCHIFRVSRVPYTPSPQATLRSL